MQMQINHTIAIYKSYKFICLESFTSNGKHNYLRTVVTVYTNNLVCLNNKPLINCE